ncbi:MAG: hypothetical protein SO412_08275, partial [Erysipelotrichaceae bacterium]|nr:hypothetical protein [Erysipelotrichaceae bacterium]
HQDTKEGQKMKVNSVRELKGIKSVAWVVRENSDGDALFVPDKVAVRFEDAQGNYYDVLVQGIALTERQSCREFSIAETMLNLIIHGVLGIDKGHWIGFNCSLSEAVNTARKAYPRESEEREYYAQKEYIF